MANLTENLQHALNCVEMYCKKWKLDINCAKTKITVFGGKVKDKISTILCIKERRLK